MKDLQFVAKKNLENRKVESTSKGIKGCNNKNNRKYWQSSRDLQVHAEAKVKWADMKRIRRRRDGLQSRSAVDHVMSKPAKLCAPLELEAFVDLLTKMLSCSVFRPVQNKHTPQVLQVLHTP